MQPAKQVKEPTDPFGMTSFNASLEEPRKNRQTVATTHLIPLRPAPRPPQPRSQSVVSPGEIHRDFINLTAAAMDGGFFDTYAAMPESDYATMTREGSSPPRDASVESNPYANLAASPPKNSSAPRQDFSEYIHPTPPKPRQVTSSKKSKYRFQRHNWGFAPIKYQNSL